MAMCKKTTEKKNTKMKNKFGNEIKVIDLADVYKQVQEANVRHLRAVRDRYRKYHKQQKVSGDGALRAEQLCQLSQWKKQLGLY